MSLDATSVILLLLAKTHRPYLQEIKDRPSSTAPLALPKDLVLQSRFP